ncbi:hypothetical protein GCM10009863_67940 [Streptomyces axinellae]|uniref:Uncharacterized protein n=1 Tax=Streptomyces axinellae TaxID=552788 RepID=A0ABP6DE55_9ACTN
MPGNRQGVGVVQPAQPQFGLPLGLHRYGKGIRKCRDFAHAALLIDSIAEPGHQERHDTNQQPGYGGSESEDSCLVADVEVPTAERFCRP